MKRELNGSVTIEAAYVIPLILVVFGVTMTLLFYYHDKTLLLSAIQETAVYASSGEEKTKKQVQEHFEMLVKGRTILLEDIQVKVSNNERRHTVSCEAKNSILSFRAESHMERTEPENYIRTFRKLEKIGEEVTDK